MAHSRFEVCQARPAASGGGVPGVPEIVEVQTGQAHVGERLASVGLTSEVATSKEAAGGTEEDEGVWSIFHKGVKATALRAAAAACSGTPYGGAAWAPVPPAMPVGRPPYDASQISTAPRQANAAAHPCQAGQHQRGIRTPDRRTTPYGR
jgi:hypothetical protein